MTQRHPKTEIRAFSAKLEFQVRAKASKDDPEDGDMDDMDDEDDDEDEDRALVGYASVFNSAADLGDFNELIAPGAFTRSLQAVSNGDANVFALWSHDWSQPLGSTRGGKLQISQDEKGLAFRLDPKRMTPAQLDAAKDGDMRMSFGFVVTQDDWAKNDDGSLTRTISDLTLHEISPVAMPAYADTSAALRSKNEWQERIKIDAETKYDSRAVRSRLLRKYSEHKTQK